MATQHITACIDGSSISASVCDAAAWASRVLDCPLHFLHVLEKAQTHETDDLSGAIGLGSREHLLEEIVELESRRSKLAVEHGKHILDDAQARAERAGAIEVTIAQRHDALLNALMDLEAGTRLFVLGRLGDDHDIRAHVIGSHVESVVRSVHTPILMAAGEFTEPNNYMLAYDGSDTAKRAIQRIARSPLLAQMKGYMVMVGEESADHRSSLREASQILQQQGLDIQTHLVQGEVVSALMQFQMDNNIDLKVMGAYGHSRIREFILGSHTTRMLSSSTVPVLILR